MSKSIFISLPVKDIAVATRFYAALGCEKNPQFSDENTSCMNWSETITFMLLAHETYVTFVAKPIADARATSGVIIALSLDSREAVDALVAAAGGNGGQADPRPATDMGFMYQRTFEDPDGNLFEPLWMTPMRRSAIRPEGRRQIRISARSGASPHVPDRAHSRCRRRARG